MQKRKRVGKAASLEKPFLPEVLDRQFANMRGEMAKCRKPLQRCTPAASKARTELEDGRFIPCRVTCGPCVNLGFQLFCKDRDRACNSSFNGIADDPFKEYKVSFADADLDMPLSLYCLRENVLIFGLPVRMGGAPQPGTFRSCESHLCLAKLDLKQESEKSGWSSPLRNHRIDRCLDRVRGRMLTPSHARP